MTKYRCWCGTILFLCMIMMLCGSAIVIYADPYFHYHTPVENKKYKLGYERYTNDGIIKKFSYDALITGTSMTENFKVSEMNQLFGVNAVKVPFSGATYKEINNNLLKIAPEREVKYIVRALDLDYLVVDKDAMEYSDEEYPQYLYDKNLWNDTSYVLNKTAVLKGIEIALSHEEMDWEKEFDSYENWNDKFSFGKPFVLQEYEKPIGYQGTVAFSEDDEKILLGNLEQNVLCFIRERPDTTFYLFFPPYSIYWWNTVVQNGELDREIEMQSLTIAELLKCDNVKLYTFFDNYEMICNLDNYRDDVHYGEWINSKLLVWMKNEQYLLTKENYLQRLENIKNYYKKYEYQQLFD